MKINYKGFMRERIQRNPITIGPDASFYEARNLIHDKGIRHLPVIDKGGHLVGIVTDRDVQGTLPSPLSAAAPEEYEALLDAHNEAVYKYNRDIGGRVFTYGTPAARRIAEREQELQAQGETITALETELGGTWYESEFSSYTIKEVLVHW